MAVEMMIYHIKVVPDAKPDDDGYWVTLPLPVNIAPGAPWWTKACDSVRPWTPSGYHVVSFSNDERSPAL